MAPVKLSSAGTCGLCLKPEQRLVKSHIVPQALMTEFLDKDGDIAAFVGENTRPTRSPTGVWSRILCHDCEQLLKEHDEYSIRLTRKSREATIKHLGMCSVFEDTDPNRLKLALLSILYRAHLSPHEFYERIQLGPYADVLRRCLYEKTEVPDTFAIFIRHLDFDQAGLLLGAGPKNFTEVFTYSFYLPHFNVLFKVDKRPFPLDIHRVRLGAYPETLAVRQVDWLEGEKTQIMRIARSRHDDIKKLYGRLWDEKKKP